MENVQVQLVDTPPLTPEFVESELYNLIRQADLILLVVDLQADPLQQLEDTGQLLLEHRLVPCHLQTQVPDQRRLTAIPCLGLVNKSDGEQFDEDFEIFCELLEEDWPLLCVSAATGRNLELLKQTIYERLEIMRIYTKAPGQEPDFTTPLHLETRRHGDGFSG